MPVCHSHCTVALLSSAASCSIASSCAGTPHQSSSARPTAWVLRALIRWVRAGNAAAGIVGAQSRPTTLRLSNIGRQALTTIKVTIQLVVVVLFIYSDAEKPRSI